MYNFLHYGPSFIFFILRQNKRESPHVNLIKKKDTISMDILLLGITDPNLTIDLKYQYISYIEEKTIKNSKVLLCHL